jgi:O-antigen ligase
MNPPIARLMPAPGSARSAPAAALLAGVCVAMGWAIVEHSRAAMLLAGLGGALGLVALFAELGAAALWLWPALGVIAYPLASKLPGAPYVTFDRVWVGCMLVLLVTLPAVRARSRASPRMMLCLGLLVAVVGARAILTPDPTFYPARVWFNALALPLILFAVTRRAVAGGERRDEHAALALAVAGTLLSLIGVAERLLGFELASLSGATARFDTAIEGVRISGPYEAPEPYGLALVICLAATLFWLLRRRPVGIARTITFAIVALHLVAIFFTFFRVGWISAVIVVVTALGLRPRRYARLLGTLVIAGVVCAFLLSQLEHSAAVSNRVGNTENIATRLATYQQGWQIFLDHRLFGVGVTRYHAVAAGLPKRSIDFSVSEPYPHSSFIEVMAEAGVIGLIALLAAFASTAGIIRALGRASHRSSDREALLAAALTGAALAYLLYSASLTMLPYSPPNEFMAMLLGIGAGRLDRAPRGLGTRILADRMGSGERPGPIVGTWPPAT